MPSLLRVRLAVYFISVNLLLKCSKSKKKKGGKKSKKGKDDVDDDDDDDDESSDNESREETQVEKVTLHVFISLWLLKHKYCKNVYDNIV